MILAYLYIILSVVYLIFGVFYKHLKGLVPKFFPLLDYVFFEERTKKFWLIWDGIALLGVGYLLSIDSIVGLGMAFLLSAWEVLLSYYFYWVIKKDTVQAWGHFIIHAVIIISIIKSIV